MFYQVFGLVSASFFLCLSSAAAENIRLAGSDWFCSGRVEIYHNGVWGTVCDDSFDNNDAEVVCKQLGCGRPSTVHASAYFGEGTGEIWLNNVGCSGNEDSLSQCSHSGFGSNNCNHSEDVGVTCLFHQIDPFQSCSGHVRIYHDRGWRFVSSNGFNMNAANVVCRQRGCGPASSTSYHPYSSDLLDGVSCSGSEVSLNECQHSNPWTYHSGNYVHVACSAGYPVRLIGPSRCAGRVEIYHSGWQTVCDDGWDLNDAQVVCRQMGCGTALAATHSAYFGKGTDNIFLDDVACTGSETHLTDCSHRGIWVQNCTHDQDAGVICSAGLIRLVGPSRCSGRVEIYNNGSWGTICNNSWNINEARVVCRQLGCGTSLSIHHFGEGFGQINEVTCTGSERHLSECSHSGFGAQHCNHSQDAGVICSVNYPKPNITIEPTGVVMWGEDVNITCWFTVDIGGGSFIFTKSSGPFSQTVHSSSSSATLHIQRVSFEDEGVYQCKFQSTISGTDFSDQAHLNLTVILPKPSIIMDPAGVVGFGELVAITCSISTQYLGGSFTLETTSASFYKTQLSSTNSSTFRFLEANSSHVGDYRCYYNKTLDHQTFISPLSDTVTISVTGG